MDKRSADKLLKEAIARLKRAMEDEGDNRKLALADLEFTAEEGKQWPESVKAEREADGRPCLTINKMPVFVDQVVGDQRMNRPSIKVVPVDSKGDVKVANILGGWIKHVLSISKADIAIDHGFEHAVTCGYGALRVVTRYVSDMSFDQEAYVEKIDNALAVFWGPHSEYDCSDAKYCFIVTDMDREEYKSTYGEDPMPFNATDSQFVEGWSTKDTVRLAEYFVKEVEEYTLYLLQDGTSVKELPEGVTAERKRKVKTFKIKWYLISGNKVLDEREWLGKKYIPVVPIWGKEINIGGKRKIRGLIRWAKDAQRMYNYWVSSDTEVVALQPKYPWLLTPKQIEGHESMWRDSHRRNYPYLIYNSDSTVPGGVPQRQAPPTASSAMVERIQMTDQEIRDTVGLQKAALGMQSNERSGAAIRERKKEGDVGTFAFIDNLSRSVEQLGRILVDIAPQLLDTERIIRLGLEDGTFAKDAVNVKTDEGILNDLSVGVYDVVVTTGPSFTTQRTEALTSMQQFVQYYPQAAPLIGDLYAKAMDWPGAEKLAERLVFLLPPEIKAKLAADEAMKAGEPPPQPPQPQPDPTALVQLEQEKIKLEEAQIKLAQEQEKLKGLQIKNELEIIKSKESVGKMVGEILGESNSPTTIPGREFGGSVQSNQPYIVGENGPEVIVPAQDGTVIPNVSTIQAFDPEGTGYDYASALAAGIKPDATGHWPSRNPVTGQLLKGAGHETFPLTIKGEQEAGYVITKGADGRYYSFPKGVE